MGDAIKKYFVRSFKGEKSKQFRLYFDTGSPCTFISEDSTAGFSAVFELPEPKFFRGLGHGKFKATHYMHLEVKMSGYWISHSAYVVPFGTLPPDYELLVGHNFMQNFNITIQPHKRNIILDKGALRRAQLVL